MRPNRKLLILAGAAIALAAFSIVLLSLPETATDSPPHRSPSADTPSQAAPHSGNPSPAPDAAPSEPDYLALSDPFRRHYLVEVAARGEDPHFGLATTAVEGRETIRGADFYKVVLRITGIPDMREPILRYCRKSADAWIELDGEKKHDPAFETIHLPLPPRTSLTWDKDTPDERSNWKIEGTESITLAGKTYPDCLRVSYERHLKTDPDYFENGHYWLAPGIGLVKQVASVNGTRFTFTLDHRTPEAIAFVTTWSGGYKGVRADGGTGGSIQLSADGRYTMIRSWADSAVDSGRYEQNPTQPGELILHHTAGPATPFSLRRKDLGNGNTLLILKCLETGNLLQEEFHRDASDE